MKVIEFTDIKGKIIEKIIGADQYSEEVIFKFTDISFFVMKHECECCERVAVEDISGNIEDLIGEPLFMAEAVKQVTNNWTSATWSFIKFATRKGCVTFRWCGESNGYYSEVPVCQYEDCMGIKDYFL